MRAYWSFQGIWHCMCSWPPCPWVVLSSFIPFIYQHFLNFIPKQFFGTGPYVSNETHFLEYLEERLNITQGPCQLKGELMGWSAMLLAVFPVNTWVLEAHLRFLSSRLCLSSWSGVGRALISGLQGPEDPGWGEVVFGEVRGICYHTSFSLQGWASCVMETIALSPARTSLKCSGY